MKIATAFAALSLIVTLTLAGCASRPSATPAPKAEPAPAAAPAAPAAKAPETAPIPPTVTVTPNQLTVEEIQARRTMEKELDRDHGAYLKAISERSVDIAITFAPEEKRAALQTDIWRFLADYTFDNWEVTSKKIDWSGNVPTAEIKAMLVVYQKNVVAPQKLPHESKWRRVGDKWLLNP